jgi:SAM-dependent methyltransferase
MEKEIFGWFPEETQEALDRIIKEHNIKSVLEVGCFLGKSTSFIAKRVETVTVVDPFVKWEDKERPNGDIEKYGGKDFYVAFVNNMINARVLDKITIVRANSIEALPILHDAVRDIADLIYIDALHDYRSVHRDIKNYLSLKPKIICGDDYDDNWPGVKKAVDEIFGDKIKVEGRFWYVML